MNKIRASIRTALSNHLTKDDVVIYEKAIYDLHTRVTIIDDPIENYGTIAYTKVGEIINAKKEGRSTILSDIAATKNGGDVKMEWNSTLYSSYKERYLAGLDRTQMKPKSVKGMHKCNTKGCGSDEFYVWQAQTRSADEGMTNFRECAKCGKRNKS